MSLADAKYMLLTTFAKDGSRESTPVWVVPVSDGRVGFWTIDGSDEARRLTDSSMVTVQACNSRGKVNREEPAIQGTAEVVHEGPLFDEVLDKVEDKYGVRVAATKLLDRLKGHSKAEQDANDAVVLIWLG